MVSKPVQIAIPHSGPSGGKGQKFALWQDHGTGDRGTAVVQQTAALVVRHCGVGQQCFMKGPQNVVQPHPKVALVHIAIQLIDRFQAQLPQRKKTIRTLA